MNSTMNRSFHWYVYQSNNASTCWEKWDHVDGQNFEFQWKLKGLIRKKKLKALSWENIKSFWSQRHNTILFQNGLVLTVDRCLELTERFVAPLQKAAVYRRLLEVPHDRVLTRHRAKIRERKKGILEVGWGKQLRACMEQANAKTQAIVPRSKWSNCYHRWEYVYELSDWKRKKKRQNITKFVHLIW